MRLIDADKLKSYIDCGHLRPPTEVCFSELDVCNMIDKSPTVSAEAEWIPCSERLPNESDDYLCTIPLDADETYTEVLTFHKGRFYEDDDEWGATYHDDVLAWMPLPTPYKGGEDE